MYDIPVSGEVVRLREKGKVDDAEHKKQQQKPSQDWLDKVVEAEIIPRLLLAHKNDKGGDAQGQHPTSALNAADIAEFTRIVLHENEDTAEAFIQTLFEQGVPLDRIFLELFSPTARLLGEYWLSDTADFVEVTLALSRLQQMLRQFCPRTDEATLDVSVRPKILLATVPGEQHTFGIYLLEEFFRRDGWNVTTCITESEEDLRAQVRADRFQVVGFSLSRDELLDQLESGIHKIRMDFNDEATKILVGGKSFLENTELARQIGADGQADDALEALVIANSLTQLLTETGHTEEDHRRER